MGPLARRRRWTERAGCGRRADATCVAWNAVSAQLPAPHGLSVSPNGTVQLSPRHVDVAAVYAWLHPVSSAPLQM